MMFRILLSTLLVFFVYLDTQTSAADEFAKGVVYLDANENGKLDSGEQPLPGVRVSNGVKIVKTDSAGKYSLPVGEDTFVFVIKPRGYRTAMSPNHLPRFYYHHKPGGSPELKFRGIKPTGPLPESIDFPLYKQEEPDQFKAIMFGDPQPRNQKEVDYIAHDVLEELVGTDASLGVTLGDILFDDLSLFESSNQAIALLGIPWYNVIGNHDINLDAKNRNDVNQTFEKQFGPTYYSFDYGSTHFVVLDDIDWFMNEQSKRYGYRGGFGEEQLEFLKNDLALIPKNQFVCLMMHIPIVGVRDRNKLYELIKDRPLTISISGHTHHHEHLFLTEKDGFKGAKPHHHIINVTVSGSWWSGKSDERGIPHATMADGAPNGYSMITFDGKDYQLEFKAAGRSADYQMRITVDQVIPQQKLDTAKVFANIFNGSSKSKVVFRIDNQTEWKAMSQIKTIDPGFKKMVDEDRNIKEKKNPNLSAPKTCPHLWESSLPSELKPGTHLITIKTTDMHGKVHTGHKTFRVSKSD